MTQDRVVVLAIVCVGLSVASQAHATNTYYIDEGTSYSGAVAPCKPNNNLNTVTASLQSFLDLNKFSPFHGQRYINQNAWSTDFIEGCSNTYGSGGADNTYADAAALVVFAGHGNAGLFAFQTASSGSCFVDFKKNMRLGSMNGAQGTVGMWLTCDTLDVGSWGAEANYEWLQQQLGFANTINIGDDEPADFFVGTNSSTNVDAWINEFNNDGRAPVAISYGDTAARAQFVHSHAQMAIGGFLGARTGGPACGGGQPRFYYTATYVTP